MKQSNSPTLVDVAREAGVSVSTAGRVIRDAGWPVDPALKAKVQTAAAGLGYVPNMLARSLRGGAPALVGLVAGNMLDPYYGEIAETVTRHAEATHMMLALVCNMQRNPILELKYCRQLWEHRVAGLILAGGGFDQTTHHAEFVSALRQMMRGGVVVTTLSPRGIDAPMFCVDNTVVGQMAAAELVSQGHRNVGIAMGRVRNQARRERLAGMISTLEAAGVRYAVSQPGPSDDLDLTVAALLVENPKMTGLIASTHMTSLRIINQGRRMGRSIPDELSIIAIGNAKLVEWSAPHLTYIDLNLEACSRAALEYIASKVSGGVPEPPRIGPPRLIRGESVLVRPSIGV